MMSNFQSLPPPSKRARFSAPMTGANAAPIGEAAVGFGNDYNRMGGMTMGSGAFTPRPGFGRFTQNRGNRGTVGPSGGFSRGEGGAFKRGQHPPRGMQNNPRGGRPGGGANWNRGGRGAAWPMPSRGRAMNNQRGTFQRGFGRGGGGNNSFGQTQQQNFDYDSSADYHEGNNFNANSEAVDYSADAGGADYYDYE